MKMINRREALLRMGGLLGLGIAGNQIRANQPAASAGIAGLQLPADKPFSIAHITDVHLFDKRHAVKWFSKCLHDIQSRPEKPAFILNTGDTIMDSGKADKATTLKQWNTWHSTVKNECSLPIFSCVGNHDVWGVRTPDSPEKTDALFGKAMALEQLKLEKTYYSFDQGGWHFVMLDSILQSEEEPNWFGRLDDEQFAWLEKDLAANPADRPVVLCTHIPIVQVCSMVGMQPDKDFNYEYTSHKMLTDARRIIDLLAKHPNVKLSYSGHTHRLDRVELSGVTYICGGAVSGSKWQKQNARSLAPGYSIATLHPDGTVESAYHNYGWKYED